MSTIVLSESGSVRLGLDLMLEALIGPHEYVHKHVETPIALYIIELAKRAEDRDEWFPHGKWATIQSIQAACEKELASTVRVSLAKTASRT